MNARAQILEFDEETHTYTLGGKRLPSVTQIIGEAGLTDYSCIPAAALEVARAQGKATHTMIELDSRGTLDVENLPAWMQPVWRAWRDFKAASGFVPILNEYRTHHPTLLYAGTLDLLCELPKLKGWAGASLVDVKRSLFAGAAIGLQLAGYEHLLAADPAMPKVGRRGALRIGNDGRFLLEPFDDRNDRTTFLALLAVRNFKQRHNLLKG